MDATLIVVDSDAELARALKSLDSMMDSDDPADVVRLAAQARRRAAAAPCKCVRVASLPL